jgi:hypothetical protein
LTTAVDGKSYRTKHNNLDVFISVGYRVKSLRGTQFRPWALEILREYIVKGFSMNDDLLKKTGRGNYWREILISPGQGAGVPAAIGRRILKGLSTGHVTFAIIRRSKHEVRDIVDNYK